MGHALLFILVLAMSGISARAIWRNVSRGQCGLGFAMRAAFLCTVLAPQTVLYALLPWMNLEAPGINGFVSSTLGSEIHFHVRLQMLTLLSWVGLEASYASFMRRNAWELSAAGPSNPHAARAEKTVLVLGWLLAIAAVAVLANHYQTFRIGQLAGKIAVGMRMQWNSPDRAALPAFAFAIRHDARGL
jgi:hypothetical protein